MTLHDRCVRDSYSDFCASCKYLLYEVVSWEFRDAWVANLPAGFWPGYANIGANAEHMLTAVFYGYN
jgi:hypothetical protein